MAKESRKITREQAVKELQETLSAVGKDEMADNSPAFQRSSALTRRAKTLRQALTSESPAGSVCSSGLALAGRTRGSLDAGI
jgi:hypothetical protein